MVIKYPAGMAILMLPFFLIAHVIAMLLGYSADGFSAPYEVMVFVGHTFYLLVFTKAPFSLFQLNNNGSCPLLYHYWNQFFSSGPHDNGEYAYSTVCFACNWSVLGI